MPRFCLKRGTGQIKKMILRDYQEQAINALMTHIQHRQGNPCVVAPTGAGKSVILSAFIKKCLIKWPHIRVIVLAHVKELVQQNAEKMHMLAPLEDVGIFSAGLKSKNAKNQIIFAGIQSVHNKTFTDVGAFDLIIIDEAHRIPDSGDGQYRTFINDQIKVNQIRNRIPKIVGLTATPFRMKSGMIVGKKQILTEICYDIPITKLIADGYLTPPISAKAHKKCKASLKEVKVQGGEFVASSLEAAMMAGDLVPNTVQEIIKNGTHRKSWLIFSCGIAHAEQITEELQKNGIDADCVHSEMSKEDRDRKLSQFKSGTLKAIVNVNVLIEGFDAPKIDLVALVRATKSNLLYCQMVGRGLRLSDGKENCLVLDFGQNISRHGPIDSIVVKENWVPDGTKNDAPTKMCPECDFDEVALAARYCPECDFEFPEPEWNAEIQEVASQKAILSETEWHEVSKVTYGIHKSLKSGIPTLKVTYDTGLRSFSEWHCVEHKGYARLKAEKWWNAASDNAGTLPRNIQEAMQIIAFGKVKLFEPQHILVREAGKYPEILKRDYMILGNNENIHQAIN